MSDLARILQSNLQTPVIDQTGLPAYYDFDIPDKIDPTPATRLDETKRILLTNFGLKLVPARQPHEVFIIEKLK